MLNGTIIQSAVKISRHRPDSTQQRTIEFLIHCRIIRGAELAHVGAVDDVKVLIFAGAYGVYGRAAGRRMAALFEQTDLESLRRLQVGRLSGGMRQRLALACALIHEPELVFLDEPTAGVDPAQRQRLWDFLYALCEGGTSLFVTTHYLDEAERCHAVGFMLEGRLIAEGDPRVMRGQLRNRLVGVEVARAVDAMRALRTVPGVEDVTIHGHELRVCFERPVDWRAMEEPLRHAAARVAVPLDRVYPLDPTLEDLFLHYERRGAGPS